MSTIKISLRKDKPLVKTAINGKYKYPLELVYQISGQRKYFNTGEKVFEENWNNDDQKAVFLKKGNLLLSEINEINHNLSALRQHISKIETRFEDAKQLFTPEMVIDELRKIISPVAGYKAPTNSVFDFIDRYITEHSATRVKSSLSVYRSMKKHLQNYEKDKKIKITFDKINYSFFQSFYNYLIEKTDVINVTANKQISTLKTFLGYAEKAGIQVPENIGFGLEHEELEVIALTNNEFENLLNLDLSSNKALDQVRDVFCFGCVTGLRYSDLKNLKRENIKTGRLEITVKKTGQILKIPLNAYSLPILKKYQGMAKPLPVISNQRMNDHLKTLCRIAEINEDIQIIRKKGIIRIEETYKKYELIGCHTARKTFCTLSLAKGMNAETVMSISGHKDYKSFKRYITIDEDVKAESMSKAWGSISALKAVS